MKKLLCFIVIFSLVFLTSYQVKAERDGLSMISWEVHLTPKQEQLDIDFIVKNNGNQDVTLEFPTSQYYDYSIYDVNNKEVFRFSKGRYFLQAFQYIRIPKGEKKVWKGSWKYTSNNTKFKEGLFVLKAIFMPSKINGESLGKRFVASEEFSIPLFKDLNIQRNNHVWSINGTVKNTLNGYFYTVENGHNLLVEKTPLSISNGEFTATIPVKDGTYILTIFNKEGQPVFVTNIE